jgi:uncharacterized protein (DUF2384 family)
MESTPSYGPATARLRYILNLATSALGDEEKAELWIVVEHPKLEGEIPLVYGRTEEGLEKVKELLRTVDAAQELEDLRVRARLW